MSYKWACPTCAEPCQSKKACKKNAKDDDEDACGCCEHDGACRPWACPKCFTPCDNPSACQSGEACGCCECEGVACMPWCCPSCGVQCKDPSACGSKNGDACGCCDCPGYCIPTNLPMDGVVPPGGHHMGDTVSRRACGEGPLPTDCVVFVGDSDIEYWEDSGWSSSFPDAVNIGMGGATIREAARHVESMVAAMRPKGFVVLCSGENDMEPDSEVEPLYDMWKFTVETILASDHKPRIIMLSTKPEPDSTELYDNYKIYDDLIKDYCESCSDVVFIDLHGAFNEIGNPRELYRDDGLHMTDMGYEIVTARVKAIMEE
eukprot:gnl/TRDRNA2_/TRDRNA2_175687_c1_seq1.p1 gnl/TRDRNA2_/TRDRNA2_175687_c1~~gnl/TRDRNA2_/TRDRNA2_175687_c1_seq1.p1  ORF type:complete len:318 (-),score=33.91 gnl/TRDRNA2_/TRDRNA2_175687_c1_seq1:31-984(-)